MGGVLWLLGWTAVLAAGLGAILHLPEILDLVDRLRRRYATPPPPPPADLAIEEIARALRRLRPQVLAPTPGMPMARRIGTAAAYDDLLAAAARALDVPDTLSGLPPGTDREAERLRVEHLLEDAGLRLQ